jgi:hypothetical protein
MAHESEKGTGRHPHKSTEEPWHHTESRSGERSAERMEGRSGEDRGTENRGSRSDGERSEAGPSSDRQDLKSREYRDKNGEIHHHTHTSQAMKDRKDS